MNVVDKKKTKELNLNGVDLFVGWWRIGISIFFSSNKMTMENHPLLIRWDILHLSNNISMTIKNLNFSYKQLYLQIKIVFPLNKSVEVFIKRRLHTVRIAQRLSQTVLAEYLFLRPTPESLDPVSPIQCADPCTVAVVLGLPWRL